jgi:hypothetical protein
MKTKRKIRFEARQKKKQYSRLILKIETNGRLIKINLEEEKKTKSILVKPFKKVCSDVKSSRLILNKNKKQKTKNKK